MVSRDLATQVDFNAKSEYEMIGNYKVLQATFSKLGVDKVRDNKPPAVLEFAAPVALAVWCCLPPAAAAAPGPADAAACSRHD